MSEQYLTSYQNEFGQFQFEPHSLDNNPQRSLVKALLTLSTDQQIEQVSPVWTANDFRDFLNQPHQTDISEDVLLPFIKQLDLRPILIDDQTLAVFTKTSFLQRNSIHGGV